MKYCLVTFGNYTKRFSSKRDQVGMREEKLSQEIQTDLYDLNHAMRAFLFIMAGTAIDWAIKELLLYQLGAFVCDILCHSMLYLPRLPARRGYSGLQVIIIANVCLSTFY